jgi:ferredoxin
MRDMLGLLPWPNRTPLNVQIRGTLDEGSYVIEKIAFESLPKFYVTANLYIPKNRPGPAPAVVYVCGPERLIDATRAAARSAGIADDRIRFERFTPAPVTVCNRAMTVTLKRSEKRIAVAAGQSILDAALDAGVAAPSGCRSGTCGTCRVKVLEGEPEHRDAALGDAERSPGNWMCICVSRAKGTELTLEL